MKCIKTISLLFFLATSIVVCGSLLVSCKEDTPNNEPIENPDDNEQPVDKRIKWAPYNASDCPQELWNWCITEGRTSGFPTSEEYDYSDFSHTVTHLLIFDYWNYKYNEFSYANLLQKEVLHIFSYGSTSYALSRLSNKIFVVSRIGDNLKDYNNQIFYTESGNYECTRFIAMDNKTNFYLKQFAFDSVPNYFWMYLHDKGEPDNTQTVWTETGSVSFIYNPSITSENGLPVVNIYTCFPDKLVLNDVSCSWCWINSDDCNQTSSFYSIPQTFVHKITLSASENKSTSARSGDICLITKDHTAHSVTIHVTQAGNPGDGSNDGQNDDWVKVHAEGYRPYWFCPSTGETIPSTPGTDSDVNAYKNTKTGTYKVTWAYKEYTAKKGYNKIVIDKDYHSVYDNQFKYWKSCCDYFYYEFTIYE